jgi:hypothetical protein
VISLSPRGIRQSYWSSLSHSSIILIFVATHRIAAAAADDDCIVVVLYVLYCNASSHEAVKFSVQLRALHWLNDRASTQIILTSRAVKLNMYK